MQAHWRTAQLDPTLILLLVVVLFLGLPPGQRRRLIPGAPGRPVLRPGAVGRPPLGPGGAILPGGPTVSR